MSTHDRILVSVLLSSLFIMTPVVAHHGWSGYDTEKAFTLTGTIVKASYSNPHTQIDVKSPTGKIWHCVLAPPSRMMSRGVTEDMITVGKTATVYGYPHASDENEARIEYLVLDGKRYELR